MPVQRQPMRNTGVTCRIHHLAIRSLALVCRRMPSVRGRGRLARQVLSALCRKGGGMRPTTVWTRHGFRVECDLGDWICQYIFSHGSLEESTVAIVERLIPPSATVVDVGANLGFHTLLFSKLVGPTGRVVAFEPMPLAIERLEHHIRINDVRNVTLHRAAAGAARGGGTLFLGPRDHTSLSSLRPISGAPAVAVETLALDDALEGIGPVTLLKVDTEGTEGDVLAGARRTLEAGVPYIVVEVNETSWVPGLLERGYTMYRIVRHGLRRVDDASSPALPAQYNALFVLGALPAWLR